MPIIRKKLIDDEVYPSDLRYDENTDTVQSLVNGDWIDNPEADPRKQTTFPPRITASTECDAAQSVADALQAQLGQVLTAIENAATLFTIAGLILGIFTFGTFDVFIALALGLGGTMVDAGSSAVDAALSPANFDTLKCILRCQFNSSGRINDGGLATAEAEVTDQIGGLGALIINAMLSLAGVGGINNLASLGTSTGDCDACDPCGDPCYTHFNVTTGVLIGIFDGYMRVRSSVSGTTSIIQVDTGNPAICCKLLDVRDVDGGENIAARYHILCGQAIVEGNIASGWGLEGCYDWLAAQSTTGTTPEFTVEFLFVDC